MICKVEFLAIHIRGPHIAPAETGYAATWAKKNHLPYLELSCNPLEIEEVARNDSNRCYFCKKRLFSTIAEALAENSKAGWRICDGANADDLKKYRPGQKAAREAGAISPLLPLAKADIRRLAKSTSMDWPEQAARPCLLTRFTYGARIEETALKATAACEAALEQPLQKENIGFRLRFLPQPELHLDRQPQNGIEPLLAILAEHGFSKAPVRVLASLSGYFDQLNQDGKPGSFPVSQSPIHPQKNS